MNIQARLSITLAHLRRGFRKFATLALPCICTILSSCGTGGAEFSGPTALETGHWYRASTSPPVYYPKGLPHDAPTGHRQGSWVYAGDEAGTRFFIPAHGAAGHSTQQLTTEALAAMNPEKRARLGREQHESDVTDVAAIATEYTGKLVLYSALAVSGAAGGG